MPAISKAAVADSLVFLQDASPMATKRIRIRELRLMFFFLNVNNTYRIPKINWISGYNLLAVVIAKHKKSRPPVRSAYRCRKE
jgi:hypothetical protein